MGALLRLLFEVQEALLPCREENLSLPVGVSRDDKSEFRLEFFVSCCFVVAITQFLIGDFTRCSLGHFCFSSLSLLFGSTIPFTFLEFAFLLSLGFCQGVCFLFTSSPL